MKDSVSVIVPAYQEEENIRLAIQNVILACKKSKVNYEIIVIDDGSTDKTAEKVKQLMKKNPAIRYIHHKHNRGLGYCFARSLKSVSKEYISVFPGDNDMSGDSLSDLLQKRHRADIVFSYIIDNSRRTLMRKLFSKMFVIFMNAVFSLRIKYYNGPFICKSELVRAVPLRSDGLLIFAELKVRLIKKGCSYAEIPFRHTGRIHGQSKALSIKSLIRTVKSIMVILKVTNL